MVDLVLVRHGRTDWNAVRRIQGQANSQLDELGHAQAKAVAPVLAALRPTVLWSSDSDRTRTTAAYVAAACDLEPTYDARLREYSFGELEGLYHHEFEAADPAGYQAFRTLAWDDVRGVEREADVAARMSGALEELVAQAPDDGVVVAVSHGASIRTAVGALLGWPAAQALTLRGMDNCGYAILRRPPAHPTWALDAYNRVVAVETGPDLVPAAPVR